MSQTFQFELVSPEKLIFSKPVSMVTVPGGEGEYGILPDHAPMITTLKPGVIKVFAENTTTVAESLFVAGGFADVTQTGCTILADEALPVAELDRATLQEQAKELADKIAASSEDAQADLREQQAIIAAKIQAAA